MSEFRAKSRSCQGQREGWSLPGVQPRSVCGAGARAAARDPAGRELPLLGRRCCSAPGARPSPRHSARLGGVTELRCHPQFLPRAGIHCRISLSQKKKQPKTQRDLAGMAPPGEFRGRQVGGHAQGVVTVSEEL